MEDYSSPFFLRVGRASSLHDARVLRSNSAFRSVTGCMIIVTTPGNKRAETQCYLSKGWILISSHSADALVMDSKNDLCEQTNG